MASKASNLKAIFVGLFLISSVVQVDLSRLKILANHGEHNITLRGKEQTLDLSCTGQVSIGSTTVEFTDFYYNGKLALRLKHDKTNAVIKENDTWGEHLKEYEFNKVTLHKLKLSLEGNYDCGMKLKGSNPNSYVHSENNITIRFVAPCKNKVIEDDIGYGPDEDCNEKISFKCNETYPAPDFKCHLKDVNTDKVIKTFKPELTKTLTSNGFYNVKASFKWNTRKLDLKNYNSQFSCSMIPPIQNNDVKTKNFDFPKEALKEFHCMEPEKVENGAIFPDRINCFDRPPVGTYAKVICNSGYKVKGPNFIQCRNRTWMQIYDDVEAIVSCEKDDSYSGDSSSTILPNIFAVFIMYLLHIIYN